MFAEIAIARHEGYAAFEALVVPGGASFLPGRRFDEDSGERTSTTAEPGRAFSLPGRRFDEDSGERTSATAEPGRASSLSGQRSVRLCSSHADNYANNYANNYASHGRISIIMASM